MENRVFLLDLFKKRQEETFVPSAMVSRLANERFSELGKLPKLADYNDTEKASAIIYINSMEQIESANQDINYSSMYFLTGVILMAAIFFIVIVYFEAWNLMSFWQKLSFIGPIDLLDCVYCYFWRASYKRRIHSRAVFLETHKIAQVPLPYDEILSNNTKEMEKILIKAIKSESSSIMFIGLGILLVTIVALLI
jgi:hypothetical protein